MRISLGQIPPEKFNPPIDTQMFTKSDRLKKIFDYEQVDIHITICMLNPSDSIIKEFVDRLVNVVEHIHYNADKAEVFCPNLAKGDVNPQARINTVWVRIPETGWLSRLLGKKFDETTFKVKVHRILTYKGLDKYSFLNNNFQFVRLRMSDKLLRFGPDTKRTLLVKVPDEIDEIRNIIQ
jgi:hypothetical protein